MPYEDKKQRICQLQIRILGLLAKHAKVRETLRYPAEIVRWLEDQGDTKVTIAAVSKILKKFEERGWVAGRLEDPPGQRRFYTLTPLGTRGFCELCIEAQTQIGWMITSMVEGMAELAEADYDR